jgi:3-oxoacyl-[acyl-carrier protein] reductase
MPGKLTGKTAIVTGASKGIGAAIAVQLAAEGAAVVVNYSSDRRGAERVVGEITGNGGRAVAVRANLSSEAGVRELFTQSDVAFGGKLDVLVNNAGVYDFAPLEHVTPEHFHKMFDLNVLGLILATREAAKRFAPTGGSVINISSVVATATPPTASVYSATKAAVDAVTRSLAKELGPRQIRVNSVNPGMVETEGTTSLGITGAESDFRKQFESQAPLGRIGRPNDIAPAVVFLASADSGWITGETLYVGGGFR